MNAKTFFGFRFIAGIVGLSMLAGGWVGARAESLTLNIAAASVSEAAGTNATTATVTVSAPTTNALVVTLLNSDWTELAVPATVTILSNETVASFAVGSANDADLDGPQMVTVTAQASGYTSGTDTVEVTDDDTPAYRTLGGQISGSLASNVYHVLFGASIPASQTLTVSPGAVLLFGTDVWLNVEGTLVAEASVGETILFTADTAAPAAGWWRGITIVHAGEPRSLLTGVEVAYARDGVQIAPSGGAARVSVTRVDVRDCRDTGIRVEAGSGIYIGSTDVLITDSTIHANSGTGLVLRASNGGCNGSSCSPNVSGNEISDNGADGIRLEATASIGSITCTYIPPALPPPYPANVNAVISANLIHDNTGRGVVATAFSSGCGPAGVAAVIEGNDIYDNGGDGVYLSASPSASYICLSQKSARMEAAVRRNRIWGNGRGVVITATRGGSTQLNFAYALPVVRNNLVRDQLGAGVRVFGTANTTIAPRIDNNTVRHNATDGLSHDANLDTGATVWNNLIALNGSGIRSDTAFTPAAGSVACNDLYGNTSGNWSNYPAAFGLPSGINRNGTAADAELNIATDPQLDPDGYHLTPFSACVNGGTNYVGYLTDIDGQSRQTLGYIDIGADEVHLAPSEDTDGDGLPNGWEVANGLNPLSDAGENGATGDPDGDGMNNSQEYQTGTTPTDATSAFAISGVTKAAGPGFVITWQCVPNKTYKVLYADAPGGPWLEDLPTSQITAGTGQTSLFYPDNTIGVSTKRFYKIKLVVP